MPAQDATSYDVVIVGSGVAGALIAARLAGAGVRVAVLEAGPRQDRAAAVMRFRAGLAVYESPDGAAQPISWDPDQYYVQAGPVPFDSDYERRVGGTTWHWLGNCPRLLPSDFAMRSRYGVGTDWPISYDELEPWYVRAEHELGIAGDSEADHGSPRSAPYPMPPLPLASGDLMFQDAAATLGLEVVATPQARNSVDGFQRRPQCCGNATCIPVCPIQAKYDATVHVAIAERAGAHVVDHAVVTRVTVGDDGLVSAVTYKDGDRRDIEIRGRLFVVAANAIETPKLLLMSTGDRAPNGVANSSDQVGRNLSDHPEVRSSAVAPTAYKGSRGPLQLSGIDSVREGPFRGEQAALRFEVNHSVGNPMTVAAYLIGQGIAGAELPRRIADIAPFEVRVSSMLEQLPDPDNRVLPDPTQVDAFGIPQPRLIYSHDDYTARGADVAKDLHTRIFQAMGATEIAHDPGLGGAGHLMGTARMGHDAATSVTDGFGRAHDHANLFIAGSALFPTSGTANPTLTIAALALRTAAEIGDQLGVMVPSTPMASG